MRNRTQDNPRFSDFVRAFCHTKGYILGMRGGLNIRKVRTASGARAVQIVRYVNRNVRHIGSAHTDEELKILMQKAETMREELCLQPSLMQ